MRENIRDEPVPNIVLAMGELARMVKDGKEKLRMHDPVLGSAFKPDFEDVVLGSWSDEEEVV